MIIAMTGASGHMGIECIREVLALPQVRLLKVLLLKTPFDRRYARTLARTYGDRIAIRFGDVRDMEDCRWLVEGADYVFHLAAVIPPLADHDDELTVTTNYDGTVNMVNATIEAGNTAKFVHISTVAIYGNRHRKHPWGRVGDPLIPSPYDVYGTSKMRGERYVLESGLNKWAILRQTGVLYDNLLMNNISDGLMFHTPWNVPIEWATAKDSGRLLSRIVEYDGQGKVDDFWYDLYNLGDGAGARQTGYDTFDDGFRLIGGSVKTFFKPHWNAPRNFHCFWFADSDKLEEMFHFRTMGTAEFWAWFKSRHAVYAAGRIFPLALLRAFTIKPLLRNSNAPMYWKDHGMEGRVFAAYGEGEVAHDWRDFALWREDPDYESIRKDPTYKPLSHGYDDSKPKGELNIEDVKQAALFRGGKCLSESMAQGDWLTPLTWECHQGHVFQAKPVTVLRGGHWCPVCCSPDKKWDFDRLAKHIPYIAQVWYDTHAKDENRVYEIVDGVPTMERFEEE